MRRLVRPGRDELGDGRVDGATDFGEVVPDHRQTTEAEVDSTEESVFDEPGEAAFHCASREPLGCLPRLSARIPTAARLESMIEMDAVNLALRGHTERADELEELLVTRIEMKGFGKRFQKKSCPLPNLKIPAYTQGCNRNL